MTIDRLLILDALTCLAMGALLVIGGVWLAGLLHLPPMLLFYAGLVLFPVALLMALIGMMDRPSPAGVWLVILGNAGWVLASLLVLLVTQPNAFGTAFVLLQVVVVAVLTLAEYRARPAASQSGARA
ncbi:hypothetical protein JJJ17_08950 [Paracoccus caeni]|uniref:Integral membrane protein n=1 Tax=Paracoccus caeni TaxID=657651 RepID=A0A934SC10_9RHOB|nr:hypothetical protein [Paracoccus caeni]MBK4216051.1 hypothetical protein [Paracoccus caeni]